jgi:hypothetical protein
MTAYLELDALMHGKNHAKTATGDADRYWSCIARSFRPRFSPVGQSG